MVVKAAATAAEATATAENKLPEKGGTIMKYTYTARKVTLRDNFKERAEKKLEAEVTPQAQRTKRKQSETSTGRKDK